MNLVPQEPDPDNETSPERSDGDQPAVLPASTDDPLSWWVKSKPLRITLFCFAGWGALVLTYQLISALGEFAAWFLLAIVCIALAATYRSWKPGLDRWFARVLPEPHSKSEEVWIYCRAIIMNIIGAVIGMGIFRYIQQEDQQDQLLRNPARFPSQRVSSENSTTSINQNYEQAQRRELTRLYWQAAVANLHVLRFTTPTGEQSAAEYMKEYFDELDARVHLAKATSTHHVEPDLLQMAQRHLALDEQCLQLKPQLEQLQGQSKKSADTTLDEGNSAWLFARTLLQLDPELLNKILAGPERELVKKVLEIEEQREGQLREIEIMQAVLRERLPGTPFSLPSLEP